MVPKTHKLTLWLIVFVAIGAVSVFVLHAYEFKWSTSKQPSLTETFAKNYPDHTFTIVSPDNYQDFVRGRI